MVFLKSRTLEKEFRISLGESIESFAEGVNRVKEVRGEHVLVRVGSDLSAMASRKFLIPRSSFDAANGTNSNLQSDSKRNKQINLRKLLFYYAKHF